MAHVREVKFPNAARSVNVLRVVDDEVRVERQKDLTPGFGCEHGALMRGATGIAIAKVVSLAGRDFDLPVVPAESIAEVGREAVRAIGSGDVHRIEQRKSVLDRENTVSITTALQSVEIVIELRSFGCLDTFDQGLDILEVAVLVVDTLRPVSHLLDVEHLQHRLRAHVRADRSCRLHQLVGQSLPHELPQHAVVSGEGVGPDAVVVGLLGDRIVVGQHSIVTAAEDCVGVVRQEIPLQSIPGGKHHVLGPLVHSHEVIGEQVPCAQRIDIEILRHLCRKALRVILASIDPTPQPLHSRTVFLMRIRPYCVGLVAEFQCIVELRHIVRCKQTQRFAVIQKLETDTLVAAAGQRLFIVEPLDTFETVHLMAFGLLVVEVELAEISVRAAPILIVEPITRESIDTNPYVVFPFVGSLRGRQESALLPDIIHQPHRSCVVRRRRIGEVRLQAEYLDRSRTWLERVAQVWDGRSIHCQRGSVLIRPIEIEPIILAGVSC